MKQAQFPSAFIESLRHLPAAETAGLLDALQTPAPVSIRYNERKPIFVENSNPVPWCASGRYLEKRPVFTLDPLLHAGAYYVQEASSMFLAQLRPLIESLGASVRALDLCAAPGGKSTLLANTIPSNSLLVSNDVIRSRAVILSENSAKWGFPNTLVTNNDPKRFGELPGFFDLLLIDAPCSGEGMFRKDTAAIGEWSPANVQFCAERQQRIVADAWDALRENGILIYSTCTFNRSENEENVQWIMDTLGAKQIAVPVNPAWGIVESDAGYRFYPQRLQGEGLFISVLRKTAPSPSPKRTKAKPAARPTPRDAKQLTSWLTGDFVFEEQNNRINAYPAAQYESMAALFPLLNSVQAGVPVGERKGVDIIPETALALSDACNKNAFQCVNADLPTALSYLRRDSVHFPDATNGLLLICYALLPLGFAKKIGNRTNNLYPLPWRIRMKITDEKLPFQDNHA